MRNAALTDVHIDRSNGNTFRHAALVFNVVLFSSFLKSAVHFTR